MEIADENMQNVINVLAEYKSALMVMKPDNLRANLIWAENHPDEHMRDLGHMIRNVAANRNIEPDADIYGHCVAYHGETCQVGTQCREPFMKP